MTLSIQVDNVETLVKVGERLGGSVFRGHGSRHWKLESTLERAANRWKVDRPKVHERETMLIQAFQRRAHHYISNPPDENKLLEWAALLQHYGGPTRLLDVTRSYLIAAFFAVERVEGDGIIGAFNTGTLSKGAEPEIEDESVFNKNPSETAIRLVQPFRLNERMITQQGAFLLPYSVESPLVHQINQTMRCNPESITNANDPKQVNSFVSAIWRIVIPRVLHSETIRFLSRSNISAATLFPDLDGFARSLHTVMRIYD